MRTRSSDLYVPAGLALLLGVGACGGGAEPLLDESTPGCPCDGTGLGELPGGESASPIPEAPSPLAPPSPIRPAVSGRVVAGDAVYVADDLVFFEQGRRTAALEGAAFGSVPRDGVFELDGVDDFAAFPGVEGPAPDGVGELNYGTISVWLRYDDIHNGDQVPDSLPILYYGRDWPTTIGEAKLDGLAVYVGHGELANPDRRQIYFTVYQDYDVVLCFDSGMISLEPGTWYHYAVTIGPDGHHGYLNGREFERHYNSSSETSHAFFSTIRDRHQMTVGSGLYGLTMRWWHFNGAVAELRIFDRILSANEIAGLAGATF
jgi:hypothetical protein